MYITRNKFIKTNKHYKIKIKHCNVYSIFTEDNMIIETIYFPDDLSWMIFD